MGPPNSMSHNCSGKWGTRWVGGWPALPPSILSTCTSSLDPHLSLPVKCCSPHFITRKRGLLTLNSRSRRKLQRGLNRGPCPSALLWQNLYVCLAEAKRQRILPVPNSLAPNCDSLASKERARPGALPSPSLCSSNALNCLRCLIPGTTQRPGDACLDLLG